MFIGEEVAYINFVFRLHRLKKTAHILLYNISYLGKVISDSVIEKAGYLCFLNTKAECWFVGDALRSKDG